MDKERLIVNAIAWNLSQDRFDTDGGEVEMIEWIVDTYKFLSAQSVEFLLQRQYENSLETEEANG